jgi:hypothetical protein
MLQFFTAGLSFFSNHSINLFLFFIFIIFILCVQAVQALYTVSSNVRVLLEAEEVARYISSNREKLLMFVNGLIPVWKKYVPVDKAIKVIKRGLAENSKVSQNEFFFDDVSYNDLKKGVKGYNSATNEQ